MRGQIVFKVRGSLKHTDTWLRRVLHRDSMSILRHYGEMGVELLRKSTPIESGRTAEGWSYIVENNGENYRIVWCNANTKDGYSVALLIQYGHGTRGGTFVSGHDYINPALKPVYDGLKRDLWKEVKVK